MVFDAIARKFLIIPAVLCFTISNTYQDEGSWFGLSLHGLSPREAATILAKEMPAIAPWHQVVSRARYGKIVELRFSRTFSSERTATQFFAEQAKFVGNRLGNSAYSKDWSIKGRNLLQDHIWRFRDSARPGDPAKCIVARTFVFDREKQCPAGQFQESDLIAGAALVQTGKCVELKIVTHDSYSPPPRLASRDNPIIADIPEILECKSEEYPAFARRNEEQGTAVVLLAVSSTGKVDACSVVESSGSVSLDNVSCRQAACVAEAKIRSGNPFPPGRYERPVRWQIGGN